MATEEITISELELADEVLADMTLPVDNSNGNKGGDIEAIAGLAWFGFAYWFNFCFSWKIR